MEESANIMDLIKEKLSEMTVSQMKIANRILTDPTLFLFSSVEQVARQLDMSTATVVRFAKILGMHGYSQLQEMLRNSYGQRFEPVVRMNSLDGEEDQPENPYAGVYQRQMKQLENFYTPELEGKLRQAVELLCDANHIYMVGVRGSFACAYYLGHHFNRILGNCDILEDNARLSDELLRIQSGDVLFVVNQPRYSKQVYRTARFAREMNAKVIAISDTVLSPYDKLSDVYFTAPIQSGDFHNSLMASMMIAEILITGVVNHDKNKAQARLRQMEYIIKEMDIFL